MDVLGLIAQAELFDQPLRSTYMQNDPLVNTVAPGVGAARGFARRATENGPVSRKHRLMAIAMLLGFVVAMAVTFASML